MTPITQPLTTEKAVEAQTILARSVCLTLTCHYLGNHRKVAVDDLVSATGGTMAEDAEEQLNATMKLIDQRELSPVLRVFGHAKSMLRRYAISAHRIFGERTYLIPLDNVDKVEAELVDAQAAVMTEAAALASRYQAAVERQREKLEPLGLFRPKHYLEPWRVAKVFTLDWSYVSFKSPEKLETVSAAIAHSNRQKTEAQFADMFQEVRETLRATALRAASELVHKLGPDRNGRPKAVRGTAFDDITEFVAHYRSLNITDDTALDAVMDTLKRVVTGTQVEDVRKDQRTREQIITAVGEAVSQLEVMTVRRRMDLDDE